MKIVIESYREQIRDILKRVSDYLLNDSGKAISETLQDTIRDHYRQRYPNATHNFLPKEVNVGETKGNEGSVDIDTKGIGRYFHDVTIKPIRRSCLTIPVHSSAIYHKAADFNDLFPIRTKDGKSYLARNNGGSLTFMFRLAKSAFQKQDKTLLPNDYTLADSIFARIKNDLDNLN